MVAIALVVVFVAILLCLLLLVAYEEMVINNGVLWAQGLPFGLGDPIQGALRTVQGAVRAAARTVEGTTIQLIEFAGTLLELGIRELVALVTGETVALVATLRLWDQHLQAIVDAELRPRIESTERAITGTIYPAIGALRTLNAALLARIEASELAIATRLLPALAAHDARLRQLEAFAPMLAALQALAPSPAARILALEALGREQAGRVAGAERALEALRGAEKALEGRVGVLSQDLARVLPLAVLAALGAVALQNLARVGRDPCRPCGDIDLNDQESRLAALEVDSG